MTKYPLGSLWKQKYRPDRCVLVRTMDVNYKRRKDYLNPLRVGLIAEDKARKSHTTNPFQATFLTADPENISEKEWIIGMAATKEWNRVAPRTRMIIQSPGQEIALEPGGFCNLREITPPSSRVSKSYLCVKCQANPLRRNCECLGTMIEKAPPAKQDIMVARMGWDNITIGGSPGGYGQAKGYLHMESDTKIVASKDGKRWHWNSKRNPESGRATVLYSEIEDANPIKLMEKAEALMKRTGHSWGII